MKKIYYIILLSIIPNFYLTQIFKFSFTGLATCPTPNNTPFIQNPNVNVTPLFRQGVNCSATASSFNSNAWPTATVQDLNSYVEVTIVATSGYQMNLASFSFDLVRSASGPVAGRIAMDDGTGTFSQTNDFTPTESSQTITWDFADYTVQSGYIIRFRIYGWQASSGTGTLRLNNVTLLGAVTQSSNNTGSGNSPFTVSGTNVGLGTTNPLTKLDVRKDLNTNDYINIAQNNSQFQIGRVSDNKSLELAVLDNGISIIQSKEQGVSYNPLILNPANNGNVGIGTLNPSSKLTVAGDIAYGEAFSNTLFRDDAGAIGESVRSGFYQTENPVNYPSGATGWWHLLDIRHSNFSNNYALQLSGSFFDQNLWFRKTNNNGNQPWRKVLIEQPNGKVNIREIAFVDTEGGDDTDPYRLRKVQGSGNNNWLELQLNDDSDESFRIYGNSCEGFNCTEYSENLYHKFDSSGNVYHKGNVGIGTDSPQAKLDVVGTSSFSGNMKVDAKIEAKEIKVTTTPTADFVFSENYALPKLEEVEKHIKKNKHLPEILSAKEMEKEGVNIGEFQIKLLQKIEELTLYSIEQNKKLNEQNKQIKELKEEINKLKNNK